MKTTKAIALLSLLALMPACTTTTHEQDIAFYDAQKRFYTGDKIFAGYYLDRNNKIRPFHMPQ